MEWEIVLDSILQNPGAGCIDICSEARNRKIQNEGLGLAQKAGLIQWCDYCLISTYRAKFSRKNYRIKGPFCRRELPRDVARGLLGQYRSLLGCAY